MKPFTAEKHHEQIIILDRRSNHGRNYLPFKRELMDMNAINLTLDQPVYRIFSIDKFIQTISEKRLCLVRPALWQDPFENFLLRSIGVYNGQEVGLDQVRDSWYGQCWTLREECDGLWRNYKGQAPSAIKVKSTVEKLMDDLYDLTNNFHTLSYFIGLVNYVQTDEIVQFLASGVNILDFQSNVEFARILLTKRSAFDYEKEVRLLFSKPNNTDINLANVKNPWNNSDFFYVNFDPNSVFDEIEVDPWISQKDFDDLSDRFSKVGYHGKITRSGLYDDPMFRFNIK